MKWLCDNESLVDVYTSYNNECAPLHHDVLAPEWGVLHQSIDTKNDNKSNAQQIKAHQDDHTKYNALFFGVQLNCGVNKLATLKYEQRKQGNLILVPKMPSIPVQLTSENSKTIRTKISTKLRLYINTELLQQYIAE